MVASVLAAELVIMIVLPVLLPGVHGFAKDIADAAMLAIIIAPLVWSLVIAPLRKAAVAEGMRAATAMNAAANGILITDRNGATIWVNPAFTEITGYSLDEAVGANPHILKSGTHSPSFYKELWDTILSGRVWRGVMVNRRKDGSLYTEEQTISPVLGDRGEVESFIAIKQDITERKRAEEALRESEHRYRSLFENMLEGYAHCKMLFDHDEPQDFVYIDVNHAFEQLTGLKNVVGEKVTDVIPGIRKSNPELFEIYGRVASTGTPEKFESYVESLGIWFSIAVYSPGKEYFIAVFDNITERKKAEEALRLFRTLIDRSNDAIEVVDPETGRFLDVNEKGCLDLGYSREEVLALRVFDIDPMIDESSFTRTVEDLRKSGVLLWEGIHRRKSGSTFPVEVNVRYVQLDRDYIVTVVRDITERKRLEEQLHLSRKLEAVGRLAGGVAHDFNNLLTVIIGYGQTIHATFGPQDPLREKTEQILRAAERAAGLTRQLLAFGRKQVIEPQVIDLNALISDTGKMLRRVIGEDIDLKTVLQPALGRVKVDQGQIEQVLMNLAVNARDAMPNGGKLTIETRDVNVDEPGAARLHPSFSPGRYVLLAVSDTGIGMDAETQSHIFEPFFTTKEKGQGTGLGLATVYGIVKQSGGYIWVNSEPGQGATFKVYLPPAEGKLGPARRAPETSKPLHGTETILLVEDEEAVRRLARAILEGSGYLVLEACDPHEGLRLAGAHPGQIHLVLTDVVMPGMSGREMADRLSSLRPDMKVLYVSGYTDNAIVQHGVLEPGIHLLQKPFTPGALQRRIREILDGPGDGRDPPGIRGRGSGLPAMGDA